MRAIAIIMRALSSARHTRAPVLAVAHPSRLAAPPARRHPRVRLHACRARSRRARAADTMEERTAPHDGIEELAAQERETNALCTVTHGLEARAPSQWSLPRVARPWGAQAARRGARP
jgi:hypothetical protein